MEKLFTTSYLVSTLVAERLRDFTDIVNLQRVHRDLFGAIVDQIKLSAFVQGTSKLSFPLCRIRFINSLLELPRLHSPSLEVHLNGKGGINIIILFSPIFTQGLMAIEHDVKARKHYPQ